MVFLCFSRVKILHTAPLRIIIIYICICFNNNKNIYSYIKRKSKYFEKKTFVLLFYVLNPIRLDFIFLPL